jgi:thioredoxin-like negative regulator of GroEL
MRLRNRCNVVLAGLAISLIVGITRATPASAASMRWRGSIPEASADAQPLNRPIMLDFWADWCAPCKVMETEVYTNSDFVEASEQFMAVRINADKEPTIARKYRITALPTLLFTDSYGNELFRYIGAMAARPLTELLRALPHDVTEFNRLNQLLARDKNNFEALKGMGENLRTAGLYRASNNYYERALQHREAKTSPTEKQFILSDMGANYLDVKDGKHAANLFEKCLKEFPTSPRKEEWALSLVKAHRMTTKKD